jgi:hypothetical protein
VDNYLCYFRHWLITHLLSEVILCRLCLVKVHMEFSSFPLLPSLVQGLVNCLLLQALFTESLGTDQLLAPPRFSGALRAPHPLCCMSFLVPCLLFSFLCVCVGGGQSVQEAMLVFSRGSYGNTVCHLFAHLLVCISLAGLEQASGAEALLFPQCNMAWRSFIQARGVGYWSFASSWCFFFFFLSSVAPVSQQDFCFTELMLSASFL